MLQGSARTWLNSLPKDSINCWEDFTSAFTHNFTSTYDRPNLPRQLALCVQGKDEPLRDYLSRWIKLKNSCEGVHEIQAIQYFTDGCLADSMLKHKLLRKNFTSLRAHEGGQPVCCFRFCDARGKMSNRTLSMAVGRWPPSRTKRIQELQEAVAR